MTTRIALFAEGCGPKTAPRDRERFDNLWRWLAGECAGVTPVAIVGFSKGAFISLAADARGRLHAWDGRSLQLPPSDALDVTIAEAFRASPFDVAVIAFDKKPPNDVLGPHACIRNEIDFVLEHFARRRKLPDFLLDAADRLRGHYGSAVAGTWTPRPRGRPPRLALDFVCMVPEFEALVADDEVALRRAVGFPSRPKDWPWNRGRVREDPKKLIEDIIDLARTDGVAPIPANFRADRHGWALHILRSLRAAGRRGLLQRHPIGTRLATVLA